MMRTLLAVAVIIGLSACDKPTKDDCRKALLNMQHLMGTENLDTSGGGLEGEVRRCQGGSTKAAVECATKAATMDDLRKCAFYKVDQGSGSAGSGSAGSGSAGSGSSGSGS